MSVQEKYEQAKELCQCYEDAQRYAECKEMYIDLYNFFRGVKKPFPSEEQKHQDYYNKLTNNK